MSFWQKGNMHSGCSSQRTIAYSRTPGLSFRTQVIDEVAPSVNWYTNHSCGISQGRFFIGPLIKYGGTKIERLSWRLGKHYHFFSKMTLIATSEEPALRSATMHSSVNTVKEKKTGILGKICTSHWPFMIIRCSADHSFLTHGDFCPFEAWWRAGDDSSSCDISSGALSAYQ